MGLKLITALFICMALYEATEGARWSKCKPTPQNLLDQGWPPCFMEKKSRRGSAAKSCRGCDVRWSSCKPLTEEDRKKWGFSPRVSCFKVKGKMAKSCRSCESGSVKPKPKPKTSNKKGGTKPSTGSGKGTRANDIGVVATECLKAHNHYRQLYGNRNDLVYDTGIASGAADWAFELADKDLWKHSGTKYGENLYNAWGSVASDNSAVWTAVGKWYSEIYNWLGCENNQQKTNGTTGHFTAVVWKSTTAVGCGVARRGKSTYVVGRYNPPGNDGNYCTNVPR